MHTESPRSARSLKAVTFLRVPVLLAMGMMTMGSGLGNPGCNSGPSECEDGCAIAGSYHLQFTDSSPPSADCEALGLGLPTGPLVLAFDNPTVTTTLNDVELTGLYFGEHSLSLNLYGNRLLPDDKGFYSVRLEAKVLAPAPDKASAPASIEGEYELAVHPASDAGIPECLIQRNFTATR
ncbi:hypothetical protein [Corallococcus sp. 4LFB]|uniref:hypothetical protein n=1 Tax=Corallococcus sp. 4LFB TaxID=3383249 RepID=UPI003976D418